MAITPGFDRSNYTSSLSIGNRFQMSCKQNSPTTRRTYVSLDNGIYVYAYKHGLIALFESSTAGLVLRPSIFGQMHLRSMPEKVGQQGSMFRDRGCNMYIINNCVYAKSLSDVCDMQAG